LKYRAQFLVYRNAEKHIKNMYIKHPVTTAVAEKRSGWVLAMANWLLRFWRLA